MHAHLKGCGIFVLLLGPAVLCVADDEVVRYARFEKDGTTSYGLVEKDQIRRIEGDILGDWKPTDDTYRLDDVRLLAPIDPPKVFAVGLNYRSHLGDRPVPEAPELFFKVPTAVIGPGEPIVLPKTSSDVHYEAELVIVIKEGGSNIPEDEAAKHILGVTCGNDVSERQWQKNDLQWWRAKSADTFAPCGPYIVSGIDYDDLLVTLRHNGTVKQEQRTSDLIHSTAAIVSWISQFVTLEPGDIIYTGTPGKTAALSPGDIVEVDIEGVGVLRNPVVDEK